MVFDFPSGQPSAALDLKCLLLCTSRINVFTQASGSVGKFITESLLATGKHTVTAVTRGEKTSAPGAEVPNVDYAKTYAMPSGVNVAKVDYSDPSTLVAALRGQDVLIITMAVTAPPDTQFKLIAAAAKAEVPWVLPNEWGPDTQNETLNTDCYGEQGNRFADTFRKIKSLGVSSWIAIVCNFWYEFSVKNGPEFFGFDPKNRKAIFVDDGKTKINTTTWPLCGQAVANLLSLKILPEDENDYSPHLSQFRNNYVYISSFLISQSDILESIQRVTGTTSEDWTIEYQNHKERYESGMKWMKEGSRLGFARMLYTRNFYPNGDGNYEEKTGLANKVLGLPKEDLDEATKRAIALFEKEGEHIYGES